MARKRFLFWFLPALILMLVLSGCAAEKSTKWIPVQSETGTEPVHRTTKPQTSDGSQTQPVTQITEQTELVLSEAPASTTITETAAPAVTAERIMETSAAASTEATVERSEHSAPMSAEETGVETTDGEQQANYIANTDTKKFHTPDCSSVTDMKEANKLYFTGSRDELIQQGYEPCKRCKP